MTSFVSLTTIVNKREVGWGEQEAVPKKDKSHNK